jgi:hypothetical protein
MRKKLGEILLSSGFVTQADLDLALGDQMSGESARLGDLLVSLGRLTAAQLARALSTQHSIPFIQLPPVPAEVLRVVPIEFQVQHRLVPFRVTADSMSIAMADPSNVDAIEVLRGSVKRKITRYVAAADQIEALHAGLAQPTVALPTIAPPVTPMARGAGPRPEELFGSLELDVPQAPGPLGDDLFSGLDLSLASTPDVPAPPAVASVASRTPLAQSPPLAFELGEMQLGGIESAGLTSSRSGTFDLTATVAPEPALVQPESPGSFEVDVSEGPDDFAVSPEGSGDFSTLDEESVSFEELPADSTLEPLSPSPEPEPEEVVVIEEPTLEASAAPVTPSQQSMPSWLGSAASAVATSPPALVLHPGEWTGKLDDTPPSRLIVGAVKALLNKGLLTEAEILEALGKKA